MKSGKHDREERSERREQPTFPLTVKKEKVPEPEDFNPS